MSRSFIKKLGLEALDWLPVWTQWQMREECPNITRSSSSDVANWRDSFKVPETFHLDHKYGFTHM